MKSQYIFVEEISLIFQQNFVVKFQHVFAGKKLVNFSHIKYIRFSNSELKRVKVSGSRLYSVGDGLSASCARACVCRTADQEHG